MPSSLPPISRRGIARVLPRIQIVGTGGQLPVNVTPSGTGTGYTRSEGSFRFQIGPKRVRGLRYAFCNFHNSTGGETDGPDFTLSASLIQGGQVRRMGVNGVAQPLISAGAGIVLTDPVGGDLDAGTVWVGRAGAVFAAGAQVPAGRQIKWGAGNENYFDSAAVVSQVFSVSTFTQPAGGAASAYGFGPTAILGIPEEPHAAVGIYGDSIPYGQNDGPDNAGNKGMYEKGLANVFGSIPMPYSNFSRSGDQLISNGLTGTNPTYPNKPRIREMFGYVTDVLITLGTNDLGSTTANISLASMQAALLSVVAAVRQAGARAHVAKLLPRTTDAGNTAIFVPGGSGDPTAYTPGGKRTLYNAALDNMLAAGAIDGIVNCNSALEDPLNPGFWVTSGLTDGIGLHPGPSAVALATPVVNAWAKGLPV